MVADRVGKDVIMEAIMQSPVAALMGLASGAVDLMQRAISHDSPKAGFDEQLLSALAEAPGADKPIADNSIKEKIKAAGCSTDGDIKGLLENPQATQVLQYLCALQSMGLNNADAKALLSGQTEISDEGLKAILAAAGIKGTDIAQLMADPKLVAGLKTQLAQTVSTKVHAGTNAVLQGKGAEISDEDLKAILAAMGIKDADMAQFMADPEVVTGLKAKIAQIRSLPLREQPGGNAPDVDKMIEQATASQETSPAITAQLGKHDRLPQDNTKEITQASTEIKESVAEFLKIAEIQPVIKGTPLFTQILEAQSEQSSQVPASTGAMPEVLQAIDVLEKTLNISKKTLREIFFSSDALVRSAALDDATTQINEFLKANVGKEFPKQVTGALGLLKGALTKDEFVKIENLFKAFNQDPALIAQPAPFDKHVLQGLAKIVENNPGMAQDRYTGQVIDQIRQALPSGIKTGEGSMTLKLNPPMLGRVDVDIRMQDGRIMASFKADQPITRDILQQNMHLLKDALSEQGIKAAQFVVTTDTFNSRDQRESHAAWVGYEQGKGGSSWQRDEHGTGSPNKEHDEYGHTYGPLNGYTVNGGLDIFA
jgi:flagellar hook-length control protein FliK